MIDESNDEMSDQEIESRTKKRRGSALTQPPTKRVRGKRGILQQLPEMPLDVVYEIFGRLDPLDVLHLARTTKDLRVMLMRRSASTSIWKQARSNINGLPNCPDDLSEPQYADLAFGKNCHYCLRNLGNDKIHIIWKARVKSCTKCLNTRSDFVVKLPGWETKVPYNNELAHLIPTISILQGRQDKTYIFEKLNKIWCDEFNSLKKPEAKVKWEKNKFRERVKIIKNGRACSDWLEGYLVDRTSEKEREIEIRKTIVMDRLRKSKWGAELAVSQICEPLEELPVVKACQKELTKRVLLNLDKFLDQYMEQAKKQRLFMERKATIKERLPIMEEVYNSWISTLPANAIYPSIVDLFRMPSIRNRIYETPTEGGFTTEHLGVIHLSSSDILLEWRKDKKVKLIKIVRDACGPEYPQVLMHSCANKLLSWNRSFDEECIIADIASTTTLNYLEVNMRFEVDTLKLMSSVLQLCDYDPKTTTAREMDETNPIIECIACSCDQGRATMTWSAVIMHQFSTHSGTSKLNLQVLPEAEAAKAREQILEAQERKRWPVSHSHFLICTHCKQTGNMKDLRKHVKEIHNKSSPSDEDIVPNLRNCQIPSVYYLWPPRDEAPRQEVEEPVISGSMTTDDSD